MIPKSIKGKKCLPPFPVVDSTDSTESSSQVNVGETASVKKKKGKRSLETSSPNLSKSKKKRVDSPKQTPVNAVNSKKVVRDFKNTLYVLYCLVVRSHGS